MRKTEQKRGKERAERSKDTGGGKPARRRTKNWHGRPASDLARPGRARWHDRAKWHGLPVPHGTAVPCVLGREFGFLKPFLLHFEGEASRGVSSTVVSTPNPRLFESNLG